MSMASGEPIPMKKLNLILGSAVCFALVLSLSAGVSESRGTSVSKFVKGGSIPPPDDNGTFALKGGPIPPPDDNGTFALRGGPIPPPDDNGTFALKGGPIPPPDDNGTFVG